MLKFCNQYGIKLANDITEWYDNNELHLTDIIPNYVNMTFTQHLVRNKIVISSFLNNYYSESNNIIMPSLCDPEEPKCSVTVEDKRVEPFDGITLIYASNLAKRAVYIQLSMQSTLWLTKVRLFVSLFLARHVALI